MNTKSIITLIGICLFTLPLFGMSRSIKQDPALVLVAFGTTTRARATYDFIDQQIKLESPINKLPMFWAFTSEIVRERVNFNFSKKGLETRYLSLAQVLANLEAEGYRKVVVQPLHIFPGQEYEEVETVIKAFKSLGLRIELGETLLHKWPYVHEVMDILEKDFLPSDQGCNVITSHGTPQTFPGANGTYLGLDRYVSAEYTHVFVGAVDGILTREQALSKAKKCRPKRVRFISLMLVPGGHIMKDIMGTKPDRQGALSWMLEMKEAGFESDMPTIEYQGEQFYQSLGFKQKIVQMFIRSIKTSLNRLAKY